MQRYREGNGTGYLHNWVDWDDGRISVEEHYAAIPYSRSVLVLFTADEDGLPSSADEDDS